MRTILLFLVLIIISNCQLSHEESQNKKQKFFMKLAECLLKSPDISNEYRRNIEENKDNDLKYLREAIYPRSHKLEGNDLDAMKNCRKEMIEERREEIKREREK